MTKLTGMPRNQLRLLARQTGRELKVIIAQRKECDRLIPVLTDWLTRLCTELLQDDSTQP